MLHFSSNDKDYSQNPLYLGFLLFLLIYKSLQLSEKIMKHFEEHPTDKKIEALNVFTLFDNEAIIVELLREGYALDRKTPVAIYFNKSNTAKFKIS